MDKTVILRRAAAYREMARQTPHLKWRFEFSDRADRYETVALALDRTVPSDREKRGDC